MAVRARVSASPRKEEDEEEAWVSAVAVRARVNARVMKSARPDTRASQNGPRREAPDVTYTHIAQTGNARNTS